MEELVEVVRISGIEIDENDAHSAIPTWSGFVYQGKASIYWVLSLLNQIDIGQAEEYSLRIEHLEDFGINYKGHPLTIHQVKAYQDKSTFGNYKKAVLELMGKCAKYPSITSAHLHTCCQVEVPEKNELIEALKNVSSKTKVNQLVEYKRLLFDEEKFNRVYDKLFINHAESTLPKRVISNVDIDDEIKIEIKRFFEKNQHHIGKDLLDSEENITFAFSNLVEEINNIVAEGHAEKKKDIEIPFTRFIELLKDEFVFQFSENTATSMLKLILSGYFDEYCNDNDIHPEECTQWKENWDMMCQLSNRDFLLLCKKLTPTVKENVKNLTAITLRELVVQAGVHKTLLPMVMNAGQFALKIEGIKEMFILNKEGIHHLITTIATPWAKKATENQGKKVFEALKNDNKLAYLLYDVDYIITNELEGPFFGKIVDVGSDYKDVIPEFDEKDSITRNKTIKFMTAKTASEVFKL
ncbi:ABC-three component system protein [Mesobacillus foraminis]|uniref:ABC-three component systems C-terminal domain-containing protein n=1 Tax=Mesobacillus foraminis TaxID=279826 RepID=A0A4R2B0F4_9BACI|nr:ABC-three component system protein [Mesobacillus foraminis]TCN18944.1 hypothetical protein EV146_11831 [Mesobacillus foraminis]